METTKKKQRNKKKTRHRIRRDRTFLRASWKRGGGKEGELEYGKSKEAGREEKKKKGKSSLP
jgi:hypothetical protein